MLLWCTWQHWWVCAAYCITWLRDSAVLYQTVADIHFVVSLH